MNLISNKMIITHSIEDHKTTTVIEYFYDKSLVQVIKKQTRNSAKKSLVYLKANDRRIKN